MVADGMTVGLGSGTTVAEFLPALAARALDVRCVATSMQTEDSARALGLRVEAFDSLDRLDIAVDGADQVAPDLWLVKGGGGAHTREKIVAGSAERFVVIVSPDKLVPSLGPPVPVEVLLFGMAATVRRLSELGPVRLRDAPASPDGGLILDLDAHVEDPRSLAQELDTIPGVVGHGLFEPALVWGVLIGRADGRTDQLGGET
jgi:ribose 5-phosphate isomerase A